LKKIPETDAIFENVFQANQASDNNPKSLRVSIDGTTINPITPNSKNG